MNLKEVFSPLKLRNYRLWFFGQMFSLVGTWMQAIAQNWLIYTLTNSARILGLLSLCTFVSFVPANLIGGSLADRYPKRTIIIITQTIMIFPPLGITLLLWLNAIRPWHVILLATIAEALQGLTMPVIQSFIIELTGREELPKAIPLNSMMFNIARMIGPALSGVLIAKYGSAVAFLLNAISFLVVIAALLMMRLPAQEAKKANVFSHMKEGFKYAQNERLIIIILSMLGVSSMFCLSSTTLMPVFARDIFKSGSKGYGFIMSMLSTGAILGGITISLLAARFNRGKLIISGGLLYPTLLIFFALTKFYSLALLFIFFAGFFYVAQFTMMNTTVQLEVKDDLRGRVMSLYTLIFNSAMRLGGFIAGFLAQSIGAPLTVILMAFVAISYIILICELAPNLKRLP